VVGYRLDIAFAEGTVKLPYQINILLLLHRGKVLLWNELEILSKKPMPVKLIANCMSRRNRQRRCDRARVEKSSASYVEAGLKVPEIVFDQSAYT
jgi:hypothetical protein